MKNSYKLSLAAVAASVSLVGCGGGTSADADLGGTGGGTLVSVSNAPIYNATVTDADGQLAYQVPGTYQYKFASTPRYPISASGGWMDVNLNETFDAGTDVNLGYTMTSYSTTITPVTTYIADANETIREARLQELSDEFNISTEILLDIPVELVVSEAAQRLAILAASLTEEQVVNGSMNLTNVSTSFSDTVNNYTFDNTDMTTFITELEDTVITPLVTNGDLTVADASSNVSSVVAAVEGNALFFSMDGDERRIVFGRNRIVDTYDTNFEATDWRGEFGDWSYDEGTGNILLHMSPSETVTIHFDVLPVISGSTVTQSGKGWVNVPGEGTVNFTVNDGFSIGAPGEGGLTDQNFDFNATSLEGKSLTFGLTTDPIYDFLRKIAFTTATEAVVTIVEDSGVGTFDATVTWELINGNIVRINTGENSYLYLEIVHNNADEVNVMTYESGEVGFDGVSYSGFGMFNPIDTTTSAGTATDLTAGTTTDTTTSTGTTTDTTTSTAPTITQSMLDGQTFYTYEYNPTYQEEIYAKFTFSAGTLTRTEIINGTLAGTMTPSYEIIEGKIRVDVPAMDADPAMYMVINLVSEGTDSWTVYDGEDQDRDGTVDIGQQDTWYLSQPTDWTVTF